MEIEAKLASRLTAPVLTADEILPPAANTMERIARL